MTSAWEAGLRRSRVFLCIVTEHYLGNPECLEQLALAKRLKKPCIAFVQQETDVPAGLLDGFDDLRVYPFTTTADLDRIARGLRPEFGGMTIIDGGA